MKIHRRIIKRFPASREVNPREQIILEKIANGWTNSSIAVFLGITESTVKKHTRKLFDKLGLDNRLELALWYVEHGGKVVEGPRLSLAPLTRRAMQACSFLVEGMSNKEIGKELNVCSRTIKNYISIGMKFYGASDRASLGALLYSRIKEEAAAKQKAV